MRKKILLTLLITGLVAGSAIPTNVSWAASKASLDKINQELKAIQKKRAEQKQQVKQTEEKISAIQKERRIV